MGCGLDSEAGRDLVSSVATLREAHRPRMGVGVRVANDEIGVSGLENDSRLDSKSP